MESQVEIVTCTNPLALRFQTKIQLSNHKHCMFFSSHNIAFCDRELLKIGPMAEEIVIGIIEFREIRQVYVTGDNITVVLRTDCQWETIPDQIVRIFEKVIDEYGLNK